MSAFERLQSQLRSRPRVWLLSGVAGFIGSNLLESLLKLDQQVVGLDNFSTGYRRNLDEVKHLVTPAQWIRFRFIEGDICDFATCQRACEGVGYVLHHAALGSVPLSIKDPVAVNRNNVDGFLNMLVAARDAKVQRFVYAASSSTYGDDPNLPKVEENIGKPLSTYALTKLVNELYAEVFARTYGFRSIGLRYFNIFGRRQDPGGAYAAVIPKWITAMIEGEDVFIYGDGETSRDFCYVGNVIQANLTAALASNEAATDQVYNVAFGERTSLNQLYFHLRDALSARLPNLRPTPPIYLDFREGDVRHSVGDIRKARELLGFRPTHSVSEGLNEAIDWYLAQSSIADL